MKIFDNYAYYYNLFYGDKDYRAESETIDNLIKKYASDVFAIKLLNMGCGTGSHDYELYKLGYRVKGIDLSSKMIEIARNNYVDVPKDSLSFDVSDIREYRDWEKYDVVTSLFHVMSYQNSNEDFIKALKTAYDELTDNGLLLFDVWYGPGVLSDKPAVRVKKVEDDNNTFIRYANPVMHYDRNVVDVCYEINIINKESSKVSYINEVHSMRYFFEPEVELMLEMVGFEMVACLGCDSLKKADDSNWTVYFLARKIGK